MKREATAKNDLDLLTTNINEYKSYLFTKYSLTELFLNDEELPIIEYTEYTLEMDKDGNLLDELLKVPGVKIKFPLKIETVYAENILYRLSPHIKKPKIGQIFCMDGFLQVVMPLNEEDDSKAQSEIQVEIDRVKAEINQRLDNITRNNVTLKREIDTIVEERIKRIKNAQQTLERIANKIPVKLQRNEEISSQISSLVMTKSSIKCIKEPLATPNQLNILTLEEFNAILEIIDNCCRFFERSPITFNRLNEYDLRDVILSNLNGVFKGNAVGEAFSGIGKCDILINVKGNCVFIAECKNWKTKSTLDDGIEQILGYLRSRDSYGLIILFNKKYNRKENNISKVEKSVQERIQSAKYYINGSMKIINNRHYTALHALNGDTGVPVEIHYVLYDLFFETPKSLGK